MARINVAARDKNGRRGRASLAHRVAPRRFYLVQAGIARGPGCD
jgi:hypothetical protein